MFCASLNDVGAAAMTADVNPDQIRVADAADRAAPTTRRRTIIRRKLAAPEPDSHAIVRTRLTAQLRDLLDRYPIVVVSATAGAGKTTAVTHALVEGDRPISWLSLDGTERAAGRLLVYLEAAVEQSVPAAAGVVTDALESSIQLGEAAGLLAESLAASRLTLVCDNVERVLDDEGCRAVLSAFTRYVPAGVNVVLISRAAIVLDQGQTSDRTRIGELGESDLAFRVEEAQQALHALGHDEVDAARAVAATGGWVTGVVFDPFCDSSDHSSDAEAMRLISPRTSSTH